MKFREVPAAQRPTSEAGGNTRVAGAAPNRDLIDSVIDRWRASTMSHKAGLDDDSDMGWTDELPPRTREDIPRGREEAPAYRTSPPIQPSAPAAPAHAPTPAPIPAAARPAPAPALAPAAPAPAAEPRPSVLRKPIAGAPGPNNPAPLPSRFRT